MAFRRPNSIISPVLTGHYLNASLSAWYLCLPNYMGGGKWTDLTNRSASTLNSMINSTNGFRGPLCRSGGFGSMLFDGLAGNITSTLIPLSPPYTITCWFYPTKNSTPQRIISFSNPAGTNNYSLLSFRPDVAGALSFQRNDGAGDDILNTIALPTLNAWNFASVVVAAAADVRLYLNAVNKVTSSTSKSVAGQTTTLIGATNLSGSAIQFFGGNIDSVRISARALSDSQIADLYYDERTGYGMTLWRTGRRFGRSSRSGGLLLRRRKAMQSA